MLIPMATIPTVRVSDIFAERYDERNKFEGSYTESASSSVHTPGTVRNNSPTLATHNCVSCTTCDSVTASASRLQFTVDCMPSRLSFEGGSLGAVFDTIS